MLLLTLLTLPLLGVFIISADLENFPFQYKSLESKKKVALFISILNFLLCLFIFILFDFSYNQFQFVLEPHNVSEYPFYLGLDGISIYFVLLTTFIMPITILSNWTSISHDVKWYLIIMLLLETLLLAVFMVLDIFLFYIFFESILPPLFILIGLFGSSNKVRASFYLFLYTFYPKCKRAKHRGSPKALVTKAAKETLQLAWLMTQGMVKSLVFFSEKLLKVVDMWVIAVLSHSKFKVYKALNIESVKEQRVDGSSSSRNLGFVRCTLVAGKPVLGRKFHTTSSIFIAQSNMYKKSIHTITSSLNPWFITGFVDAEGCFTLGFMQNDKYKTGYQIQAIFKINLHKKDYNLLSQIQNYFGVGKISKHGDTTIQYTVRSLKGLDTIISHFDNYPLLTQKYGDFMLFKQGISLLKTKEHLNNEGFMKVLSIKASINSGLSDELKLSYPEVKPIKRSLSNNKSIADPNWIAGLASGDGCFYVSIRHSITTTTKKAVVLKFHIVQHSRDTEIMKMLISTLGCGSIQLLLKQSAVYFVVVKFKDIFEKIIPLFDNYPILGIRALNYLDFKKVAILMHNKEHLTEQGLSEIQSIKSNMNLSRIL